MISAFGIDHGEVSKAFGSVKPLRPGQSAAPSRKPSIVPPRPMSRPKVTAPGSQALTTGRQSGLTQPNNQVFGKPSRAMDTGRGGATAFMSQNPNIVRAGRQR